MANAIFIGRLDLVMAEITPDALAQIALLAGPEHGTSGPLPAMTSCAVAESSATSLRGETFDLVFVSRAGSTRLTTRWNRVVGEWRMTNVLGIAHDRAAASHERPAETYAGAPPPEAEAGPMTAGCCTCDSA